MADISILKQYFKDYMCSLKETSFDEDNGIYLCQSVKEVVNFDDFTQNTKDFNFKRNKSCDAVYFPNDTMEIYCIEFKNQRYSDIDSDNIRGKYVDSLTNLGYMFAKENIGVKNYTFHFFVVYQNPTNRSAYKARGSENEIKFGLDDEKQKHKDNYVISNSKIKTKHKDFFKNYYRNFFKDDIKCFDIDN